LSKQQNNQIIKLSNYQNKENLLNHPEVEERKNSEITTFNRLIKVRHRGLQIVRGRRQRIFAVGAPLRVPTRRFHCTYGEEEQKNISEMNEILWNS
jgi:hypothetical protein